ncbi:MAG TPA: Ig-like domain-containing protein [Gemmatimonadales bacterium]|nr:Ig-like domain-containing protein [Gemmatimonadales bacterium]
MPVDTLPNIAGLTVSAPVPVLAGSAHASAAVVSVDESVVYISLAPGSVPAGIKATVRARSTGDSLTTAVVNGGFDPVAISASIGDTITVIIERLGFAEPIRAAQVVAASRAPVVVRTDPPPQKRDVPLNSVMVVVFSTPLDPATLTTGSVQLWRDATPVAGTARFADALQLRVEFQPLKVLDPETAYRLVVTQSVRDVNGVALEAPVDVPFTTATAGSAAGLAFASVTAGGLDDATNSYGLAFGHTCALTTEGVAYCWGWNAGGQLGDGSTTDQSVPVSVSGGLTFSSISARGATCALTAAGAAYCWGQGYGGPPMLASQISFAALEAGGYHTCGLTTSGAAYCWGENYSGQLGNGRSGSLFASDAGFVSGGLSFVTLTAGTYHTCGLVTTGAAYCWGDNFYGALGIGSTMDSSDVPEPVSGGRSLVALEAGYYHTCALTDAGAAYCWGEFFGSDPVLVSGGLSFISLTAGEYHTCALTAEGAAYCWGRNTRGQLGDGSNTDNAAPVAVTGGLTFSSLSAGKAHTCGVTTTGIVYCWGANTFGQLGNGSAGIGIGSNVPVKVAGQP